MSLDLRDAAVHHEAEAVEAHEHPGQDTLVSREHATYTLEAANQSALLARHIILTCLDRPRPSRTELVEWTKETEHFGNVVKGFDLFGHQR